LINTPLLGGKLFKGNFKATQKPETYHRTLCQAFLLLHMESPHIGCYQKIQHQDNYSTFDKYIPKLKLKEFIMVFTL
jgi:hypothetical protein